jgi:arginine repressor
MPTETQSWFDSTSDRFNEKIRTFNKVLYGTAALSVVVYISAKRGSASALKNAIVQVDITGLLPVIKELNSN